MRDGSAAATGEEAPSLQLQRGECTSLKSGGEERASANGSSTAPGTRKLSVPAGRGGSATPGMNDSDGASAIKTRRLVFDDDTHQEMTLARLNTMRKGGHLCDVTIEIDGHCVPVHGAVLSSLSVYLFEMFSGKADASRAKNHFKLDNLDFASFEVLVNYAYTSRLECDADRVKSVYRTAHTLKMHRAAEECANFLADNLTPQNCLGICASINHGDTELRSRTYAYIQDNLQAVLERSQEFHRLPAILVDIVGVEPLDLYSGGEKSLCKLVVDWLEMALEERPIERLIENTHILYLSADNNLRDCVDDVDNSPLNNSDVVCDYKKLVKRKQMMPLKGTREKNGGARSARSPTPGGSGAPPQLNGFSSSDSLVSLARSQCTIVAASTVGDKSFMCIANLADTLASISIKFRAPPLIASNGGVTITGPLDGGRASSCPSPTGGAGEELRSVSPAEKQCSLTGLATMASARCGLGATALDGRLVALGGYDRGECWNTVESYSLESNRWTALQPMLTARGRFAVAQLDGRLYACGGSNGQVELNSVERYDPATGKWSSLPDMIYRRSSAGVAVCNGRLYVIGGWSGVGGRSTCEVFDEEANRWQAIAELNMGRAQVGVCSLGGALIAAGGCDAWNCTNTVERYDAGANRWTYIAPMFGARRGAGIARFKRTKTSIHLSSDKLYVVGGSDGHQSLVSVEIYDPSSDTWTAGPPLTTPRANTGVAVVDGRLWAVGGFSGKAFLDTVEYLGGDEGAEWCVYLPHPAFSRGPSVEDLFFSKGGKVSEEGDKGGVGLRKANGCANMASEDDKGSGSGVQMAEGNARSEAALGIEEIIVGGSAELESRTYGILKTEVAEQADGFAKDNALNECTELLMEVNECTELSIEVNECTAVNQPSEINRKDLPPPGPILCDGGQSVQLKGCGEAFVDRRVISDSPIHTDSSAPTNIQLTRLGEAKINPLAVSSEQCAATAAMMIVDGVSPVKITFDIIQPTQAESESSGLYSSGVVNGEGVTAGWIANGQVPSAAAVSVIDANVLAATVAMDSLLPGGASGHVEELEEMGGVAGFARDDKAANTAGWKSCGVMDVAAE